MTRRDLKTSIEVGVLIVPPILLASFVVATLAEWLF